MSKIPPLISKSPTDILKSDAKQPSKPPPPHNTRNAIETGYLKVQ